MGLSRERSVSLALAYPAQSRIEIGIWPPRKSKWSVTPDQPTQKSGRTHRCGTHRVSFALENRESRGDCGTLFWRGSLNLKQSLAATGPREVRMRSGVASQIPECGPDLPIRIRCAVHSEAVFTVNQASLGATAQVCLSHDHCRLEDSIETLVLVRFHKSTLRT